MEKRMAFRSIGSLLLLASLVLAAWQVFSFSTVGTATTIVFLLAGAFLLFWRGSNELQGLLEEKRKIAGMIAEAEQKVLQRELSEESFRDFALGKQKELIGIESRIAALKEKEGAGFREENQQIVSRKKHVLKGLLQQKKAVETELQISEQKYLRRELEEGAFFELQRNAQSKLLELDAEIRNLYADENIGAVLQEMQQKLKESEPTRRKRRQAENESEMDKMASDLSNQGTKED
jgi:hypothetical protein